MKSERRVQPKFVKSGVNKIIESVNKTIRHVNEAIQSEVLEKTTKLLRVRIRINKLPVRMILRAKKRLQARIKRKKRYVMVMFVSMNVVNTSNVQHIKTR